MTEAEGYPTSEDFGGGLASTCVSIRDQAEKAHEWAQASALQKHSKEPKTMSVSMSQILVLKSHFLRLSHVHLPMRTLSVHTLWVQLGVPCWRSELD